ncbi:MAG TPA: hypothetical protein VFG78_02280 [Gemmatimonadota bacterium]|nr:hypothetical protein [Gemmatimonadota bacterium]
MDGSTASAEAAVYDEGARSNLERVRAATEKFHDINDAYAAGYPRTAPNCLDNPPQGGMGLHYVNSSLLDDSLDVEHPEILVYAPTTGGKPKLAGVEYIVPLSQWDREDPPRIFDRDLKRSEALKIWYLHVWAWEENRNGLFADWNPAVVC